MIQENPLLPGAEALTMCVEMQLPTSHTYCSAETFVKLEPDLHVDGAAVSNSSYTLHFTNIKQNLTSTPVSISFPFSAEGSTDLVVRSSDKVLFYVNSGLIQEKFRSESFCAFLNALKGSQEAINDQDSVRIAILPEPSEVVNILLHTIYNNSCAYFNPSNASLTRAVEFLAKHGKPESFHAYVAPGAPLHQIVLERSKTSPLLFYSLAAKHDLYDLAAPISAFLLVHDMSGISDEYARMMGPHYLRRLLTLRCRRMEILKRMLSPPPAGHEPTEFCNEEQQRSLTRAWALTSAYLVMHRGPELTTISLEVMFGDIGKELQCSFCRILLQARIAELVSGWAAVKRTI